MEPKPCLAHRYGGVAVILKILWQRGSIDRQVPPVSVLVMDPGPVWQPAGEEGGSRGATHGLLAKGIVELNTPAAQTCFVFEFGTTSIIHEAASLLENYYLYW